MAPRNDGTTKKAANKGAWTAEEDRKLSQCIELHGARRWKTLAVKSGIYVHTYIYTFALIMQVM